MPSTGDHTVLSNHTRFLPEKRKCLRDDALLRNSTRTPILGLNLDELEKRGGVKMDLSCKKKRVEESKNESFLAPLWRKEDKTFWLFLYKLLKTKVIDKMFFSRQ